MDHKTVSDIVAHLDRARATGHTGALLYNLPEQRVRGITYAPRALAPGDVLIELFVGGRATGSSEVRTLLTFEAMSSGFPVAVPLAAYARTEEVDVSLDWPRRPPPDTADGSRGLP